jgi:hypothetical protein
MFNTGVMIDLETDQLTENAEMFEDVYDNIMKDATAYLGKVIEMENTLMDHYKVPMTTINGKK